MGSGTFQNGLLALEAEQDLSNSQYRFVELNTTTGQVDLTDAVGEYAIGVLQNDPSSGFPAKIMKDGITKIYADGTITRGIYITPSATGGGISGNASGAIVVRGLSMTAANSGEIFDMLLIELHVSSAF